MWFSTLEFIQAHYSIIGAILALLTCLFGVYLMLFGEGGDSREHVQIMLVATFIFTPGMYWLWGLLVPVIAGIAGLIWLFIFLPEQIFSLRRRINRWQRDKKLRKTTYFP